MLVEYPFSFTNNVQKYTLFGVKFILYCNAVVHPTNLLPERIYSNPYKNKPTR
jgi:hypothetical protein